MAPWDYQAVARRHRVGIGDAERQLVLQQLPLPSSVQNTQAASRRA